MKSQAEPAARPHLHVAQSACTRCLFGADPLVSSARKAELIEAALEADTFFVCHVPALRTMDDDWEGETSVCCAAFYARYQKDSLALRLATMFGFVTFTDVNAGKKDAPHE